MMKFSALIAVLLVAGCGVDGAPTRPEAKSTRTGLTGTASMGYVSGRGFVTESDIGFELKLN